MSGSVRFPGGALVRAAWIACGLVATSAWTVEAQGAGRAGELPYEALARSFSKDFGGGEGAGAPDLGAILAERFLEVPLGAFELRLPAAALRGVETAADLRSVSTALLDAQRTWLAWVDPGGAHGAAAGAHLETLQDWVQGWEPREMGRDHGAPRAEEAVRAAGDGLARELRAAAGAGAGSARLPIQIALLPEREDFVGFLCFAGWSRPELRRAFWVPGVETWTHSFLDDLRIYAMEYARPGGAYGEGLSMRHRSETGLEEQVVQLAMGDLLERLYAGSLPPSFVGAVGNNLVIELFGQVDTRVDGDLAGRTAQAREVFVPGGLPQGGILPKNRAESGWRSQAGEGYFVGLLRASQAEGKKARKLEGERSPNALGNFVLELPGSGERCVVGAPVLGPAAESAWQPPAAFEGEHQEFLRAYRSAFLHWLREHGAGKEKESRARFAGLFGELARAGDGDLVAVLERAYGEPLSNEDVDRDCLEGRFLTWLAKQRASRPR